MLRNQAAYPEFDENTRNCWNDRSCSKQFCQQITRKQVDSIALMLEGHWSALNGLAEMGLSLAIKSDSRNQGAKAIVAMKHMSSMQKQRRHTYEHYGYDNVIVRGKECCSRRVILASLQMMRSQQAHGSPFCDRPLSDCCSVPLASEGLRNRDIDSLLWGLVRLEGLCLREVSNVLLGLLMLEGLCLMEVSSVLLGLDNPSEMLSREEERPGMRGATDWSCSRRLGFLSFTCDA